MRLNDKIDFYGVFNFKSLDADGNVLEEYHEKNLIMDTARSNMAQLIAGVTVGGSGTAGSAIDSIVLGTRGHIGTAILDPQQVGEADPSKPANNRLFDSTREKLFSETISGQTYYKIPFNPDGGLDKTSSATGRRYVQSGPTGLAEPGNTVRRVVADRVITYTITIPVENANSGDSANPAVAYTEAALYAGSEIFSMKTFPARVKENTVKFEITWSIIF